MTFSSSEEEPVNATQVHRIYHRDRRAWGHFVSLAAVKASIEFKSKQFLLGNK